MRIGAYVDALNLYYGARRLCGRGTPGWRWLDVRALLESSLPRSWRRQDAELSRIAYCTAQVAGDRDPSSPTDQETYLRALKATGSVDEIVYGKIVGRARYAPLARPDSRGRREPVIARPDWPLKLQDVQSGRHRRCDRRYQRCRPLASDLKGSGVDTRWHYQSGGTEGA